MNGSSGCCDVYPGRSNTVNPEMSARSAYFKVRSRQGRLVEGGAYTKVKFVCLFVSQVKKKING